MHLKIITHDRIVFDDDVNEIYTKGVDGEFGVLRGHIPIISAL
ncbi:MAG: F0F1 ATP synthase subunit epsilon, partial [Candidatus Gastranaerophilaceae bacterium]